VGLESTDKRETGYLKVETETAPLPNSMLKLANPCFPGLPLLDNATLDRLMSLSNLPRNDGWTDVAYELGTDPVENTRIGAILNEACHVFRHHAEGTWKRVDKDLYARRLVPELKARPALVGRLLRTQDRVVKMLTYRAIEILRDGQPDW